jgi:hypothetical protein
MPFCVFASANRELLDALVFLLCLPFSAVIESFLELESPPVLDTFRSLKSILLLNYPHTVIA